MYFRYASWQKYFFYNFIYWNYISLCTFIIITKNWKKKQLTFHFWTKFISFYFGHWFFFIFFLFEFEMKCSLAMPSAVVNRTLGALSSSHSSVGAPVHCSADYASVWDSASRCSSATYADVINEEFAELLQVSNAHFLTSIASINYCCTLFDVNSINQFLLYTFWRQLHQLLLLYTFWRQSITAHL